MKNKTNKNSEINIEAFDTEEEATDFITDLSIKELSSSPNISEETLKEIDIFKSKEHT